MKKSFFTNLLLICLATYLTGCGSPPKASYESMVQRELMLEDLLRAQKYTEIFQLVEPNKFGNKYTFTPTPFYSTDHQWAIKKANQGNVPMMYLAAYTLSEHQNTSAALDMYARARIRSFLDYKSCKTPPRFPWSNTLELLFPELNIIRQKNAITYTKYATQALLKDPEERKTTSPSWYCNSTSKNNVLPEDEAYAARDKHIQVMLKDNEDILKNAK